jgi:hypothetical protein
VFSLFIDESELDIFTVMVLVLLINALDELFEIGQFLFGHYNALSYFLI